MVLEMNEVVGVLQAGGQSRRFGSPKAFANYKGMPLYLNALSILRSCSSHCIIVSHPSLCKGFSELTQKNVRIIEDFPKYQGLGPLSGLYSAMRSKKATWYVQLACDMPLIKTHDMTNMIKKAIDNQVDALIPQALGYSQPLAAVYHYRCFPYIKDLLEQGDLRMSTLLNKVNTFYIKSVELDIPEHHFINVNTKDDLYYLTKQEEN